MKCDKYIAQAALHIASHTGPANIVLEWPELGERIVVGRSEVTDIVKLQNNLSGGSPITFEAAVEFLTSIEMYVEIKRLEAEAAI